MAPRSLRIQETCFLILAALVAGCAPDPTDASSTEASSSVGSGGTILHWNGSFWSPVSSNTIEDLYDVWGVSRDDVWIVGSHGAILHWGGTSWQSVSARPMKIANILSQPWRDAVVCLSGDLIGIICENDYENPADNGVLRQLKIGRTFANASVAHK